MLAALNTVEPPITTLNAIDLQPGGAPPGAKAAARLGRLAHRRLASTALAAFLGDREHLVDGRFTAADLLMTTVLRFLRTTDLVSQRPSLDAYKQRHEARPAFRKALADQMATFAAHARRPWRRSERAAAARSHRRGAGAVRPTCSRRTARGR